MSVTKTTFNVAELLALSDQQVFDIVAPALLNQGRGAYNQVTATCEYRTPDGSKCAVGLLLDETTHSMIAKWNHQNTSFINLLYFRFFNVELYNVELRTHFINEIQNAHDYACLDPNNFNEEISRRFLRIATIFELDPAALVNHPKYRVEV